MIYTAINKNPTIYIFSDSECEKFGEVDNIPEHVEMPDMLIQPAW